MSDSTVTRPANELQTNLRNGFLGLKEGQGIMRAQHVLTTVQTRCLLRTALLCTLISSPFHFKLKAIDNL